MKRIIILIATVLVLTIAFVACNDSVITNETQVSGNEAVSYEDTNSCDNGHDEIKHSSKAPTCVEVGWSEYVTCGRNGCEYTTYTELPILEHNYVDGVCDCGNIRVSKGLEFASNGDGTCYVKGIGSCIDTEIIIPEKSPNGEVVTAIGTSAFKGLGDFIGIKSVKLPESVTSIGSYAFSGCWEIKSIVLSEAVTTIGNYAFFDCYNLESINIPKTMTKIGAQAFYDCTSLKKVDIPASLTVIGPQAFSGCRMLESITVLEDNPRYLARGNCLIDKLEKTLVFGCFNAEIPDDGSVVRIGNYAFARSSVENLHIPKGVTSIGSYAFCRTYNLKSVKLPMGLVEIGERAFYESSLESIAIPEGIAEISAYTFSDCYNLKNIVIPSSVRSIGSCAFQWCYNIKEFKYLGTKEQWKAIYKGDDWDYDVGRWGYNAFGSFCDYEVIYNYKVK